jgi:ribosomal protein S18 acetylase RimI-like enzyme
MIRRAEERDIPGILELLVQVDMVHHLGRPDLFRGPATKYSGEELREILKNESAPVFVFEDDKGLICGHAFCIHQQTGGNSVMQDVKTLYIDDICVREDCRGQGIGAALYRHVTGYAREKGFYNVTLNVWSCNPGALKFYEAMGMQPQKIGMEQIL